MRLFDTEESRERLRRAEPLAARMRPRTVEEFVGQEHFIGKGKLLWRMLRADRFSSLIFYGPPGTGKTARAHVIANSTRARFVELNASASGVGEVRDVLTEARTLLESTGERTLLFVDELHRFNRAQQDVLLPDVECGIVILIGATTQNPFFSINSPLISRSQIFEFKPLSPEDVRTVIRRALADEERGLGKLHVEITDDAVEFLSEISDGDARRALNAIEIGVYSQSPRRGKKKPVVYDLEVAQESIQRKAVVYDGTGDEHYDAASAFIKSMRGSDPDAALYWMARMLEAGEDPRFVARRMVICASEDVGNANPQALVLATAALQAVELDLNATPDALPMMAVLGCFAQGRTVLANVPQARIKETDRIAVMARELALMGARVRELPDGLVVEASPLSGAEVEGHGDHRVVMALAVAATAAAGETVIHGAEAVSVTFPTFFDLLRSLGARITLED